MKMLQKISDDDSFHLHVRWPTDFCFVENCVDVALLAWEANIDIQSVFHYYKAVTYMCCYLSKEVNECSKTMK